MPRYYRGLTDWLWITLVGTACLAVLFYGARRVVDNAEDRGRDAAYASARDAAALVYPAERARWDRERDSLALLVAQRDTVLVERIRRVTSVDTLTLTDTLVVRESLNQCSALAADCDAFRTTATAALLVADSLHRADSLARVALSLRVALTDDTLARTRRALAKAPTWKTTAGVGVVSVAAGAVLCLVFCK